MQMYLSVFILSVYVCNHGYTESIWVGPAWGLDDQPGEYNFGTREEPKTNRALQPIWIPDNRGQGTHAGSGHDQNNRPVSRALEEGSKLSKFYCNVDITASCPFGGKGPTIIKKISPKVAICVCYCSTGYSKDYGCVE